MKLQFTSSLLCVSMFISCTNSGDQTGKLSAPLTGTWKLLSSVTIDKGQRTDLDYTKNQQMIKIINDTHFSFLRHDVKRDQNGKNNFDAGGGRYTLSGDQYVEYLDYYNDPNWEGKNFKFKIQIKNDTLIQTGIEKVEAAGIDRQITETYIRMKQ